MYNQIKYNEKYKKGISLIVLVITIIVIILLTTIIVLNLSGENSIISKSKEAKAASDVAQAKELLNVGVANILADNNGDLDLKNLNDLKIDGYDTEISDTSRLVTLKNGNDIYNFLVDTSYKVFSIKWNWKK